ncbi:hypothetical protein AURDEDRAFT_65424 [Auricularia subglabra TFB-10046 SS5]|nr:hypothetical protein AURDEDRAFT_65424 [Auricularia subglabra TFB-10046 SS5]
MTLITSALLLAFAAPASASLILYGICQTGCNMGAVSCYGVACATFGTVVATPLTPAIILWCNAALGTCMATLCAPLLLIPLP